MSAHKLKPGDKVQVVECSGHHSTNPNCVGKVLNVTAIDEDGDFECSGEGSCGTYYAHELKLVTGKGGEMSLVKKVKRLGLSKDDRLLRDQGFYNECGELTEEGKDALLEIVAEDYKKNLVDAAKDLKSDEDDD